MVEAIQYFNFPNANEALDFYEENFDAVITSKVLASDPMFEDGLEEMGMSQEDAESFVMKAEFEVLGQKFMVSTTWEKKEIDNSGANVTFVFNTSNQEDYDTVKQFYRKAIEAGCVADMEEGPTEWTEYFASFKDPFGVSWMISGE